MRVTQRIQVYILAFFCNTPLPFGRFVQKAKPGRRGWPRTTENRSGFQGRLEARCRAKGKTAFVFPPGGCGVVDFQDNGGMIESLARRRLPVFLPPCIPPGGPGATGHTHASSRGKSALCRSSALRKGGSGRENGQARDTRSQGDTGRQHRWTHCIVLILQVYNSHLLIVWLWWITPPPLPIAIS